VVALVAGELAVMIQLLQHKVKQIKAVAVVVSAELAQAKMAALA
jgi:hypothetical protein